MKPAKRMDRRFARLVPGPQERGQTRNVRARPRSFARSFAGRVGYGEPPDATAIPSGCRFHPRCPVAQEECRSIDPELRRPASAKSPEHRAACILA
jgi:oligopeptide/dipeptide ABC transporter ATP-binding protein